MKKYQFDPYGDDEIDAMRKGKCPYVVGDLVQSKWMSKPGVVIKVYDNGDITVRENEWCRGTLPWRYYKKVKRFEQLCLF